MKRIYTFALAGGLMLASAVGITASLPLYTAPMDPGAMQNNFNSLIQLLNANIPGYTDPVPGRNFISNGAMTVAQRGTGILTCGDNTAPTVSGFGADRWACDVNVASGAGRAKVVTSSPSPPPGFQNSMQLYRTSGALLQPVCTMQAIETARSVQLQGKRVIVSAYLQPLAAFSAASGTVTMSVITGTGSDQGFGTLTASPAITPAWTGIASTAVTSGAGVSINGTALTAGTAGFPIGTTAAWNRVWSAPVAIPVTATEVGLQICFTPVGSGSGVTDGFAVTGVQMEIGNNAQTTPSAYEFLPLGYEVREAQRFYWQLNEPANGAAVNGFGQATGANATSWTLFLPSQMRGVTPVVAIPTTGTFKTNIAGTPTTWVTPTAGVCSAFACTITGGNTNTAGQAETLTGGGGSGIVTVLNDSIM